jgi:simple sugar transport system ATP-binding protein
MYEVEDLSDRVAILRHGQFVGDMPTKMTNAQEMTNMMVGYPITLNIDRPEPVNPQPRIEVKNLTVRSIDGILKLQDVSFTAMSGEILGIAGISGSGQKELLEAIAGLQPVESGSICYIEEDGTRDELLQKDPLQIADMGITLSFVPEDRLGMGLVASMGMTDNMMLKSYEQGKSFFVERKQPHDLAEEIKDDLAVVTPSINTPVRRLSGGNVQKVLVGREIAAAPAVLMTAYAVRGLDIGTSYQIYNLLSEQKDKGVAVMYVGEDLDVLIDLCDRILVLCAGKMTGIIDGRTATKEQIGLLMTKTSHGEENANA